MASIPMTPIDGLFAICRLAADDSLPAWAAGPARPFLSITRTDEELSIICPQDLVPDDIRCERGWRAIRVAGILDFALVGVLASLLTPLAEAGIPVFVVSTFDTDYLLIKDDRWDAALEALRIKVPQGGQGPPS